MSALQNEARSFFDFAQLLVAARAQLQHLKQPPRRWADERERQAFFADLEAHRALTNAGLSPDWRRSF